MPVINIASVLLLWIRTAAGFQNCTGGVVNTHTEKHAFPPISGNENTLINVQCCISNNACQPTLLLFYHSCTFIMFEHCLSPSQHFSWCLPLCPIFAFSPCKYNKCAMRVVFQPAKPAITPWCWHFTFDSAPWNPARFQASTFPGCRPGCSRAGDRYQMCHQWHHRWHRARCWLLLNVISFSDATNWTTILLGNSESLHHVF